MTQTPILLVLLLALTSAAYYFGCKRAFRVADGKIRKLHSLPGYYGLYVALWAALPALLILCAWLLFQGSIITRMVVSSLPDAIQQLGPDRLNLVVNDIRNLVSGNIVSGEPDAIMLAAADYYRGLLSVSRNMLFAIVLIVAGLSGWYGYSKIRAQHRARNGVESIINWLLVACSTVAILTTVGIVLSVLFESIRFFQSVPITEFLFGLEWSPQIALRADQAGSSGAFGAVPLFAGTLLITFIAMTVAVPIGLMSALYLAEYASARVRAIAKPLLEVLAGIPTVVYGFFAALTVAPFIRESGGFLGLDVASESALAAGLVMGMMIIPFVSSLSDDVINAVPQSLREGAYGMGATSSETIRRVIFPAALPGIVGAILLAVSRAIGETMIVVMAAGLASNLTANPLEAVTTVTVQIVTLLVGDQEFDSPKTLAAFALGLVLFVVTLALNFVALYIVRKYREQYD
ncbi:phosphate ABC transporter permease subunit PstC [Denitromonas ohlonensis]|uniref:Phosphate transport system permease protein n=2 Tax=Denitromonas TaxID=139331 RepID=A0A557RLG2_9RHOO|nr:phosphate ABC transporter permease subunit PstC [Denitromonas ohlonensis]TVO66014.1 phosphate ABC transporter permease subunit PstC [Denitromonas ohlonensis]TVO79607.1 phosphate ABC transporter permease subunit PstC [Denitromonas ohlonensis]TVT50520.1 MAG: phosphate ABC transporter permease subunit PstC [Denitromonas halophila]TVT72879.1 MAG: phosphate ABC transporter permease subunit PstC [Denitromonas halophila]